MNFIFHHITVSLFCLFATFSLHAQSPQPISLEMVLTQCGANNLTIQEHRLRQELAAAELASAREWWLPTLNLGVASHQLSGAAMNGNGLFFLEIDQNNLWTGAKANLNWDLGEGIFKANGAKHRAEAQRHFGEASRNEVLLQAIEAYYDLLSAQLAYDSWQEVERLSGGMVEQMEVQVQAGLQYESAFLVLKSRHQHLKIEVLNSLAAYKRQAAALGRLLNVPAGTLLVSVDSVLVPKEFSNADVDNYEGIYANRPEVQGMEWNLKALAADKKRTTTGLFLPTIRVQTYAAQFGGLLTKVTPADPLNFPNPSTLYPTQGLDVAVMWEIPLGRLAYGGDLKRAKARLAIQQTQLAQQKAIINEELDALNAQLDVANQQLTIAREGLQLAREALSQSIQRQDLGTVRPLELMQAQTVFIQSQLDYLTTVAGYNKLQYRYLVAKGEKL